MAKAFDVAEYLLSKADTTENDMTHTNSRLKGKKGPSDETPKRPTRLVPRRSSA